MKQISVALVFCMFSLPLFMIESMAAERKPCAEDIAKFCPDVKPGDGRIAACLKKHENELSPACKARQEEMKKRVKDVARACHDDAAHFCSEVKPGGGRMYNCLMEHEKELSSVCREKIAQRKKR